MRGGLERPFGAAQGPVSRSVQRDTRLRRSEGRCGAVRGPANAPGAIRDGPLTLASIASLEDAGAEDTPLGRAAVLVACRLEASTTDTGSSIAALVEVHRETMAAALELRKVKEWNPLEQIRRDMRERHPRFAAVD